MTRYAVRQNQIEPARGISGTSPICVPTLAGSFIGDKIMNSSLVIDETGNKYGRLTVVRRVANDRVGSAQWLCHCSCGAEKVVRGRSLRFIPGNNGTPTRSCGCLARELTGNRVSLLRGDKAYGWKGGRCSNGKNGYILLHKPEHPRANSYGYVLEHIYVMSKHLNRPLYKEEIVHHRNGIRDDNRVENLELWTRNHPFGQRVSDIVAYAKDVLRKYEPSALKWDKMICNQQAKAAMERMSRGQK